MGMNGLNPKTRTVSFDFIRMTMDRSIDRSSSSEISAFNPEHAKVPHAPDLLERKPPDATRRRVFLCVFVVFFCWKKNNDRLHTDRGNGAEKARLKKSNTGSQRRQHTVVWRRGFRFESRPGCARMGWIVERNTDTHTHTHRERDPSGANRSTTSATSEIIHSNRKKDKKGP